MSVEAKSIHSVEGLGKSINSASLKECNKFERNGVSPLDVVERIIGASREEFSVVY